MELSQLTAISPVDGRYRSKCERLDEYFSEYALIRYRVKVEIKYFIALSKVPEVGFTLTAEQEQQLVKIYQDFTVTDAQRIKDIEGITNHDVKAVEYFLKERFDAMGLEGVKEFIHFGLTSQDINNTSLPMMLQDALIHVYCPAVIELQQKLHSLAEEWKEIPMLAKTHGQPASPTRLGKEIEVFAYRLDEQFRQLERVPISGKFGGATGNFNAHHVAYPKVDWKKFANDFLNNSLGIKREQFTTQISNYDNLAAVFDAMRRINAIILDLDRDMWMYISMGYFKQRIKQGEVGSSAMPHKVNPIDFENSEGNLGLADAVLSHLAQKLPVSRLQRDLTDSTVIRNVGVPMAHTLIAIVSTMKGLNKLLLHRESIDADLNNTWAVVAEGIQTILRREGYPHPYEALKALTRTNADVTEESIHDFIQTLNVPVEVKQELMTLTPQNYTGM